MGYKPDYARQTVYKVLQKPEVKAELQRRMEESRMTPDEIIARFEAMADGLIPTRVIERPSRSHGKPTVTREYDTKGVLESLGKVYALFVDKQVVENIGLEIVDDSDPEVPPDQSA